MRGTRRAINWIRYSAERRRDDFKPLTVVGKGVEEIRIQDDSGAYRVIYTARRAEAVYVLHAFQKKSQATSKKDIDTARRRLAQVPGGGK